MVTQTDDHIGNSRYAIASTNHPEPQVIVFGKSILAITTRAFY